MRDFGRFLAAMALVMAIVFVANLAIHRPDSGEMLIDASVSAEPAMTSTHLPPGGAGPGIWPTNASAPIEPRAIAAEPKVIKPPPSPVSRAKFPSEDPGIVDGLALANKAVNQIITYSDDVGHYGVAQAMLSWPPDFKGDCEDYALTKMVMLEDAGLPIVEFARLRFVYAPGVTGEIGGHALLEVRMPRGGVAFLDNNFDELMTRGELEGHGFKFFDW